jgi:protein-disulfide isomerase
MPGRMDLAGGAWIFLAFLLIAIAVVAYSYYTVKGSGINQHGWQDRDRVMGTGVGKDPSADIRTWTRGTGAPRRQRRMTPLEKRTAEAIDEAAPDGSSPAWRARVGENVQLTAPVDPARDHIRGPETAAVTVVEYGEYECPYCAEATVTVRKLEQHFGDDVRMVFRHFPLREVHPNAFNAALGAEAAAKQGRFWEMNDLLGPSRRDLSPETIYKLAAKAGCDVEQFKRDAKDPAVRAKVEEDIATGLASGVNGTPTFFLNNVRYDGDFEADELGPAIEAARDVARSSTASMRSA